MILLKTHMLFVFLSKHLISFKAMGINYYSILNLKKHCTTEDVIKSFGKLVSKYSMINQVQDHNLIILCETFEVLSDPFRRALYDKYGEEGIKKGIQSDSLCIDPWTYHADVITTYLEYCVLKNPITHLCIKSKDAVLVNLKKIKRHSEIIKSNLKLTLNEIFYGSIKLVPIKRKLTHANDLIPNEVRFVKVKIPRGFPKGKTLKCEELNAVTDFEAIYIFTIKEIPHKLFIRDNMNLIMVKSVSLKQAFCGIKININTLDNKVIRVNITQVVTCDYVKIIHNEGMPSMNNPMQRGDIIIKFDIIYPLYLPVLDETRELFNNNQINT